MIVHIDSIFATLFLKFWPKWLGAIYFIRVGDHTESYVRIQWFRRQIKSI